MNWAAWHVSGCECRDEGSDGTEGEIDCPEFGTNVTLLSSASLMLGYFQIQDLWGKINANTAQDHK